MTATLTIDEAGRIELPEALKRVFGAQPGSRLRAEVTEDRIEILKDVPEITEGVMVDGMLLLPKQGIPYDAAAAVREARDELAERGMPR